VGGEHDGKIIGIVDDNEEKELLGDPIQLLGEKFVRSLRTEEGKKLNIKELEELADAIKAGELPDDPNLESAGHLALEKFIEADKKEISLKDGAVLPVPNMEVKRETPYVAAPSGAGKSTWIANYCAQVRELVPDKKIYIFSRLDSDPALDPLKPTRFLIDEDLVADPPTPSDFKDSIVIFDDIDTIPDKKAMECVQKLRDDLLETGRHEDVTVVSTSHQVMNYKKTRTLLNEASAVVLFPKSGSAYHIGRYLKTYAGFDKDMCKKIMGLPSRWFMHYRMAPQFILHEHGAMLL
jgi:hypothetical protein